MTKFQRTSPQAATDSSWSENVSLEVLEAEARGTHLQKSELPITLEMASSRSGSNKTWSSWLPVADTFEAPTPAPTARL